MASPDVGTGFFEIVFGAVAFVGVGVGSFFGGKKKAEDSSGGTQIVAGNLFASEPILALRLAMNGLESAVRENTDVHRHIREEEKRDEVAELRSALADMNRRADQAQRGLTP